MPLTIVPALAALLTTVSCGRRGYDPCEPATYQQVACENAVANRGYWYDGTWYPHIYPYPTLFYFNGYHSFLSSGGVVRSMSPTTFAPSSAAPSRASVVRGGFGGIGAGHDAAGS